MSESRIPELERELYFLVAKFLENGPCQEAAKVLRQHLTQKKLLVPRKDWQGDEHDRTYEEYDQLNNHISKNYLLSLVQQLPSELGSSSLSKKPNSLLCRGSFSLLKKDELQDKVCSSTSKKTVCSHSAPLLPSRKLKASSVCTTLCARSFSGANFRPLIPKTSHIYSKYSMHKRILGHLASVYCVLFDHTGSVIVTGADDNLLKVWSVKDGRLVATFRGHSAQITDIAINKGNKFLASGSLDKTIRIWNLHNTHPVAVLQGHTGMVTSLQFCPCADPNVRYLLSTGGDGNVCFWPWYPETEEFSLTPNKFNEKTRPGVQMLCSSFSPGGSFLVTGSTDNYIRVYQLYPNEPEKIAELPNHSDHVDSIIYNNYGTRFLSGSRDGLAMVWDFKNNEWQAKCLDSSSPLKEYSSAIDPKGKLKVTMICWSTNDKYIVTAATDFLLRVWDSYTATLVHVMKGHTDEVYILETHPVEQNLLLSGGHDGNLILWNLETFSQLKTFSNKLEGQGHGAIFDCKFSPNGLQFSATDSHGHLLIFGLGSNGAFKRVPIEQFFHTDYRPIIRDTNNYVLDDQTQTAPHLMPPPYLVDIDGNPYPSQYQMLIPGRTSSNLPQLRIVQQQPQEDLPPLLAEIAAAEAAGRTLQSPGPSRRQSEAENGLLSPGGVGLRESGNVEGVRQENNHYISGDITAADADAWRNRTIIPKNTLYNQRENDQKFLQHSIDEVSNYNKEKRKSSRKFSESDKNNLRGTTRGRGRGRGRGRARGVRNTNSQERIISVRPSALRQLEYLQPVHISSESEAEDWQGESSDSSDDEDWVEETAASTRAQRRKNRSERKAAENSESDVDVDGSNEEEDQFSERDEEEEESKSSSSETVAVKKGKPKQTRAKRKRRRICMPPDYTDGMEIDIDDESDETFTAPGSSSSKQQKRKTRGKPKRKSPQKEQPKKPEPKKKLQKKIKNEIKTKKPVPSVDDIDAYLACYAPPEWLLNVESKKFPYFPQIGDEVYYLRQGHHLYVQEVIKQNEYDIQENRQVYRRYDLSPAELCKLVGISYDVGPPKICSLKLELIGKRKSTGNRRTITVRFHDMPNVVDFLVLRHIYDYSLKQDWAQGDRFRCIIDDTWYYGKIMEVSPLNEEFLTSSFLGLVVKWDSGDEERVSPWDLEKIPDGSDELEEPITEEDKKLYEYISNEDDWPNESLESVRTRALEGLEAFSALELASPFAYPVDVRLYPTYWGTIAFPSDLETITKRMNNRFYRRIDSLLWEVRQLKTNAEKFNESGSSIVQDAAQIVKILCRFLKDPECKDIIALYNEMVDTASTKSRRYTTTAESEDNEEDGSDEEEEEEEEEEEIVIDEDNDEGSSSMAGQGSSRGSSSTQDWIAEAKSLLDFINSKDDAKPFLQPVDLEEHTDYTEVVSEPIDLSTIRHRLECGQYDDAEAYIRDFQLIFRNSKAYNTDRRSLIYKMTLRLSALFDSRCNTIRKAYALSEIKSVHMTRGMSKMITDSTNGTNPPKASYLREPPSRRNDNSLLNGESTAPYNDARTSTRKTSKITLSDYVKEPVTRTPRASTESSSSTRRSRKSVSKKSVRMSSASEEEVEESEDETNVKENGHSDHESDHSSPETTRLRTSPRKSRRSGRVPVKRVRYGFESEEEEIETTKEPALKKPRKNLNYSMDKKVNSKKPLRISAIKKRSSGRSRTAVSYCEDDTYDFYEVEEETVNGNNQDGGSGSGSSTEEEIEETDSSALSSEEEDDEENTVSASGVSSRGRVRRASTRFLDS